MSRTPISSFVLLILLCQCFATYRDHLTRICSDDLTAVQQNLCKALKSNGIRYPNDPVTAICNMQSYSSAIDDHADCSGNQYGKVRMNMLEKALYKSSPNITGLFVALGLDPISQELQELRPLVTKISAVFKDILTKPGDNLCSRSGNETSQLKRLHDENSGVPLMKPVLIYMTFIHLCIRLLLQ